MNLEKMGKRAAQQPESRQLGAEGSFLLVQPAADRCSLGFDQAVNQGTQVQSRSNAQ